MITTFFYRQANVNAPDQYGPQSFDIFCPAYGYVDMDLLAKNGHGCQAGESNFEIKAKLLDLHPEDQSQLAQKGTNPDNCAE